MDFVENAPIVSPKPCKTPNSNRINKFIFHNDITKSAELSKTNTSNIDYLYKVRSFDKEINNINSKATIENNFEKQLELDIVNNELLLIINSNSCSPININTPDSKTAQLKTHQRFFFNSIDSGDTLCSGEYAGLGIESINSKPDGKKDRISLTSILPCRTKNPFYKNFENQNETEIKNYLNDLTKSKSTDFKGFGK